MNAEATNVMIAGYLSKEGALLDYEAVVLSNVVSSHVHKVLAGELSANDAPAQMEAELLRLGGNKGWR